MEAVYQYLVYMLSSLTKNLLFLNQRKWKNGRRNIFTTNSSRKNVPDVGVDLGPPATSRMALCAEPTKYCEKLMCQIADTVL